MVASSPTTYLGDRMKNDFDLRYDRRLTPEFLAHFQPGGFAEALATYVKAGLFPLDLRPRRDVRSGAQHMTLYTGLTAVLHVKSAPDGGIRLDAHKTHRKVGGFDDSWSKARQAAEWTDLWPEVELYLERIIPAATQSHGRTEGAVQAAVGAYRTRSRLVLDREVTPSFRDAGTKKDILGQCLTPILDALTAADLGLKGQPKSVGSECDALALDEQGRVLAIEIKPLSGGSIPWVPAQALMYARVLQRWVDEDPERARRVLTEMAAQRRALGLAPEWKVDLPARPVVVPVVAVQRGASPEAIRRMIAVRDALHASAMGGPGIELLEVSLIGELVPLDESRLPDGKPKAVGASYAAAQNNAGTTWKQRSATLPEEASADEGAPYLLPSAYAAHNLLPEVREPTLALFDELGIPWHQGTDGGPSRHLRSSQVQCANALGQMVTDPDRIVAAFGDQLDIAWVRDFGEIDPSEAGRFLTFEFIGLKDYLGEGGRGKRTRGAKSTSVDAAFAYRTSAGVDELALVEWKFTENYPSAGQKADQRLKERTRRYGDLIRSADGPVDASGLELGDLFHEPIYQLVRQQILAWQLEQDPEVAAQVVRVVHVLARENLAYQRSFIAPALRGLGSDVDSVWSSLLKQPDRFVKVDPAVFLDPGVTSEEYVARYGGAAT